MSVCRQWTQTLLVHLEKTAIAQFLGKLVGTQRRRQRHPELVRDCGLVRQETGQGEPRTIVVKEGERWRWVVRTSRQRRRRDGGNVREIPQDAMGIVGMEVLQTLNKLVVAWLVHEENPTAVGTWCAVPPLPGEPSRQIDGHSATAESWYHPEESHAEISHEDGDRLQLQCQPIPEALKLLWPLVPRRRAMEVHHQDLVMFPYVPNVGIRVDVADDRPAERFVVVSVRTMSSRS